MDKKIFEKMFELSTNHPFIGKLSSWLSSLFSQLFFAAYAAAAIFLIIQGDGNIVIYLLFPCLSLITSNALRQSIKRPRPFEEYGIKPFLPVKKTSYSMPSNHSSSAVIIAGAVMYINVPVGIIMFITAILTGISRIFSGVHYPSDILAGWLISFIYGSLMLFILL